MDVRRTPEFAQWLKELRDARARAKVLARIDRLVCGNRGDIKPVVGGVSEMRIPYGPGYRIYVKLRGDVATVLWGGIKDTQRMDIAKAKILAREWE